LNESPKGSDWASCCRNRQTCLDAKRHFLAYCGSAR
jgi:hypothetical protein